MSILPTCEKLLHLIFDRGICVLPLPGKILKSDLVMAPKVRFQLGSSIRLKVCSTPPPASWSQSCPTWSWSVHGRRHLPSRRLVAQHKVTETNDRHVICPQTAQRRLKVSSPKEITRNFTHQHPALFQRPILACFQHIFSNNITLLYKYFGSSCVHMKNNVK